MMPGILLEISSRISSDIIPRVFQIFLLKSRCLFIQIIFYKFSKTNEIPVMFFSEIPLQISLDSFGSSPGIFFSEFIQKSGSSNDYSRKNCFRKSARKYSKYFSRDFSR